MRTAQRRAVNLSVALAAAVGTMFISALRESGTLEAGYISASTFASATQNPTGDGVGNAMYQNQQGYTEHTRFFDDSRYDQGTTYTQDPSVNVSSRGSAIAHAAITVAVPGGTVSVPGGTVPGGTVPAGTVPIPGPGLEDLYSAFGAAGASGSLPTFHASAHASVNGYTPALQLLPMQAFSAEAQVRFTDQLFVSSSPLLAIVDPVTSLGIVWHFDGSLSASYDGSVSDPDKPRAAYNLNVEFGSQDVKSVQDNQQTNGDVPGLHIDYTRSAVVALNVGQISQFLTFSLLMDVTANADNVLGSVNESADAAFDNTLQILGIAPYDANGNLLPSDSIQVSSEWGFSYPILGADTAVPEPSTLAIWSILFGISGVAGLRKRSQRKTASA